jgi:hypothetical protein
MNYRRIRSTLEDYALSTVIATVEAATVTIAMTVTVLAATVGSATVGAICGEVLDYVPYLSSAIPEGIEYLARFVNPETTQEVRVTLQGNLDKVGAAAGFVGGFFRTNHTIASNKNKVDEVKLKNESKTI